MNENESNIDKNNVLKSHIFSYQVYKNKKVAIYWQGKQVKILNEQEGTKFIKRIEEVQDEFEQQLIMAKITGNFKRGNEKLIHPTKGR